MVQPLCICSLLDIPDLRGGGLHGECNHYLNLVILSADDQQKLCADHQGGSQSGVMLAVNRDDHEVPP